MAIAWSRISSKVIAYPPYANEACSRRCEPGKNQSGSLYRFWVTKESRKSWEVSDAEVLSCSQRPGGMCHGSFDKRPPPQTPLEPGVHHVPRPTTYQKTCENQTASPPHSAGAPRTGSPPGAACCQGCGAGAPGLRPS